MEITEADREKLLQPNNAGYLGGRSLITLTQILAIIDHLPTYLPHVDIGEIIPWPIFLLMEITEADREKLLQPNNAGYLGDRSLITLTKF